VSAHLYSFAGPIIQCVLSKRLNTVGNTKYKQRDKTMTDKIEAPLDYIPEDQWPSVAKMVEGFGEQTLAPTAALAGTSLSLEAENGITIEFQFTSGTELSWTSNGVALAANGSATYKAIEARQDIFLIDFVTGEEKDAQNITFVYNKATGAATVGISWFVPKGDETRSTTEFVHAKAVGAQGSAGHERSEGLVGKRIYYRYSDVRPTNIFICHRAPLPGTASEVESRAWPTPNAAWPSMLPKISTCSSGPRKSWP
jgi:hypothetical protein